MLDMRNLDGFDWVWQFALYPVDEIEVKAPAALPFAAATGALVALMWLVSRVLFVSVPSLAQRPTHSRQTQNAVHRG